MSKTFIRPHRRRKARPGKRSIGDVLSTQTWDDSAVCELGSCARPAKRKATGVSAVEELDLTYDESFNDSTLATPTSFVDLSEASPFSASPSSLSVSPQITRHCAVSKSSSVASAQSSMQLRNNASNARATDFHSKEEESIADDLDSEMTMSSTLSMAKPKSKAQSSDCSLFEDTSEGLEFECHLEGNAQTAASRRRHTYELFREQSRVCRHIYGGELQQLRSEKQKAEEMHSALMAHLSSLLESAATGDLQGAVIALFETQHRNHRETLTAMQRKLQSEIAAKDKVEDELKQSLAAEKATLP